MAGIIDFSRGYMPHSPPLIQIKVGELKSEILAMSDYPTTADSLLCEKRTRELL